MATLPPSLTPTPGLTPAAVTSVCPKCKVGGGDANRRLAARWCAGADAPVYWREHIVQGCETEGEHIHRTCPVCTYTFLEGLAA